MPTGAIVNELEPAEDAALVYDVPIAGTARGAWCSRAGATEQRAIGDQRPTASDQPRATRDGYAAINTWS